MGWGVALAKRLALGHLHWRRAVPCPAHARSEAGARARGLARRSGAGTEEDADDGLHRAGDGAEAVAALERDHHAPTGEPAELVRHLAVGVGRDVAAAERVAVRSVEARGDKDELRVEGARDRHHDALESEQVLRVAHASLSAGQRGPRDVDVVAFPGPDPDGPRVPRAGVERAAIVPVQRDVKHAAAPPPLRTLSAPPPPSPRPPPPLLVLSGHAASLTPY